MPGEDLTVKDLDGIEHSIPFRMIEGMRLLPGCDFMEILVRPTYYIVRVPLAVGQRAGRDWETWMRSNHDPVRKGRYRRVVYIQREPAVYKHPRCGPRPEWIPKVYQFTLHLSCGHKVIKGNYPQQAYFKRAVCPVPDCEWPKFVDQGAGI